VADAPSAAELTPKVAEAPVAPLVPQLAVRADPVQPRVRTSDMARFDRMHAPLPRAPEHRNTMAIIALVLSFNVALAGIICGHVSLSQIKRTQERGYGMAVAALVIGYSFVLFWVILWIVLIAAANSVSGYQ